MAQMLWFNENRSCIEINVIKFDTKRETCLMKTEVVLKLLPIFNKQYVLLV